MSENNNTEEEDGNYVLMMKNTENQQSFVEELKARRVELGMSIEELGAKVGAPASIIEFVENYSYNLSFNEMRQIASALGVEVSFSLDSQL